MGSHGYPPTISGVTLVVQKLARAMVARGHAVTVVTASERGEPYCDEDEGVQLIRVRSRKNPFWAEGPIPFISQSDLDSIVQDFAPDVMHVHEAALLGLQFRRLSDLVGLPLVASCHYVPRFVTQYLGGEFAEDWVESIAWTYSVWLLNQCDHVVFATLAHRKCFIEHGLEVPTTIISNGVDTNRYHQPNDQEDSVETRYNLPPEPRILFVGRLARDKSIDVLIRAMSVDSVGLHHARLFLVGRGDDRDQLEELVDELGVGDRVHFLGFVPEEDMPALYRTTDLFAIASTCEVQSLPTLQAMATGLPVVAADALALPEIVKDGVNGLLVSPGDVAGMASALGRIVCDPEMGLKMGRAGFATAQLHAETNTFDGYEDLYQRMLRS